jgi:hypothetical protein
MLRTLRSEASRVQYGQPYTHNTKGLLAEAFNFADG